MRTLIPRLTFLKYLHSLLNARRECKKRMQEENARRECKKRMQEENARRECKKRMQEEILKCITKKVRSYAYCD
jgi:hypothetical protein